MCLVAIAHRISSRYPLIIAANREEDHQRPTTPAAFWPDAPDILGGRDELQRGTWLAINRNGRFAAVTNLRGVARDPQRRSRGALVTDFLRDHASALDYVRRVAGEVDEYPPFHLYAGRFNDDLALMSGTARTLDRGVHALSNAPIGELWEKVITAERAVAAIVAGSSSATSMAGELLQFLASPPEHNDPTRDILIVGDRYGTRSSTVVVASADEVLFIEQSYGSGGVAGGRRELSFAWSADER
jgi:uncharacterized protein with NRDE domain